LIIDDEYFNIMAIQMIVTNKFKALSDHAFNGKEALAKVKHKQSSPCRKCGNRGYVTYFIDINMPIMDGFQTVTELKSLMGRGILERGICIANTAFVDLDTKVKCLESGMDFYISKPIRVS
jgi:CheY-like chemotaxis protein